MTFNARCTASSQSPLGDHTSTLEGNGFSAHITARDQVFVIGMAYDITIAGPAPKDVKFAEPKKPSVAPPPPPPPPAPFVKNAR